MAYIKELEAKYTRKRVKDDLLRKPASNADQVYQLFKYMEDETREKLVCLHLNHALEILSYEVAAIGTSNTALVDIAGLFRGILLSGASKYVIIHNHPLHNCKPSPEDIKTASAIYDAGKLYDLQMTDFIIIGEDGFYSFDYELLLPNQNEQSSSKKH